MEWPKMENSSADGEQEKLLKQILLDKGLSSQEIQLILDITTHYHNQIIDLFSRTLDLFPSKNTQIIGSVALTATTDNAAKSLAKAIRNILTNL